MERNFFSSTVFGGNLLGGDVHSSVTMDRHIQAQQWRGNISLFTLGLLWSSTCLLEVCGGTLVLLLLRPLLQYSRCYQDLVKFCIKIPTRDILRISLDAVQDFASCTRPYKKFLPVRNIYLRFLIRSWGKSCVRDGWWGKMCTKMYKIESFGVQRNKLPYETVNHLKSTVFDNAFTMMY